MVVSLLQQTARERIENEGFVLKASPGAGLCHIKGCRNKHAGPKKKLGDVRFCHRCWQRRWRKRDFKEAAFRLLKDHAVARRIPFTLSFARFKEITDEAGYWDQQPETDADRLSVDRIRITEGYADNNVRIITKGANSAAGNRERWLPDTVKAILARKRGEQPREAWHVSGSREDSWLESETPF